VSEGRFIKGQLICPGCGGDHFKCLRDGASVRFLCQLCWTCWYWSMGWMTPAGAGRCAACDQQPECADRRAHYLVREAEAVQVGAAAR
jgi:hypothetical protein